MAKTKEGLDPYSRVIMSTNDVVNLLLNKDTLDNVICGDNEECEKFNEHSEDLLGIKLSIKTPEINISVDEFHKQNIKDWMIPTEYFDIDIRSHLMSLCNNETEKERVLYELDLYKEREVIHLLHVFLYLVEQMRSNNILWGVGRGSSVASYCLYLIGVHRINSIEYDLDIREFLK